MTAEKDVQVARKRGRGEGGEVIRAMPERKHSFLKEVFPKAKVQLIVVLKNRKLEEEESEIHLALALNTTGPEPGIQTLALVQQSQANLYT